MIAGLKRTSKTWFLALLPAVAAVSLAAPTAFACGADADGKTHCAKCEKNSKNCKNGKCRHKHRAKSDPKAEQAPET